MLEKMLSKLNEQMGYAILSVGLPGEFKCKCDSISNHDVMYIKEDPFVHPKTRKRGR